MNTADTLRASHLVWLAAAIPDFAGGASFADQIAESGPEIASDEWLSYGRQSTTDPVIGAYFAFHDCDLETLRWGLTTPTGCVKQRGNVSASNRWKSTEAIPRMYRARICSPTSWTVATPERDESRRRI